MQNFNDLDWYGDLIDDVQVLFDLVLLKTFVEAYVKTYMDLEKGAGKIVTYDLLFFDSDILEKKKEKKASCKHYLLYFGSYIMWFQRGQKEKWVLGNSI